MPTEPGSDQSATQFAGTRASKRLRLRDREDRRAAVAHFVLTTIRYTEENDRIDWDEDGDLGLRVGSAIVWISIVGSQQLPAVRLWSVVLSDVTSSPDLLRRINEINANLSLGAIVHEGGDLRLGYTLLADQLTVDELLLAMDMIMDAADRYDTLLAAEFGGQTQLADGSDVFAA